MNRRELIEQQLNAAFSPLHIEVLDESHMHSVPEGALSHFKVTLVSPQFEQKSLLQRHRAVNQILAHELENGIHALALHTMTPDEWFAKSGHSPDSPPCLGGSKTE
ncbi:MAG TPA: BolA family transcriptional regulator [Gammaproteobacteria bacterium]|nr:BolA family transcriptional regulator [Gammaproteobacteria bacterium]